MSETNTTPVKEPSCLPRFPLSKVKKIAKCDTDYIITSNAAIVAATFATEVFVQSLTEDGLSMAHLQQGKKNKNKNNASKQARLTVDDLIESVQRKEQYYFLEDVINKKMFSKDYVSKAAVTKEQDDQDDQDENNQSSLAFGTSSGKNALQAIEADELSNDEDAMDIDNDQEHGEGIIEGVEEDDGDEDEDGGDIQEDEEGTGLQTEINSLHNVEDIDVDKSDSNDDMNEEEGDKAKQRLVGRAETVEEVESAEE